MIEFSNPLWFMLIPLPYLIYKLVPSYQTKQSAIKVPFFSLLLRATSLEATVGAQQLTPTVWQRYLFVSCWFLIVLSMAKPMWLGEIQTRELSGRDVMFVLDLSGSMAETDFVNEQNEKISRLDAAKDVLGDFVDGRKGDRFGLIVFGDNAYLQSPFTSDYTAWLELLEETDVAMAGQSTHIGDAIGLSIKLFSEESQDKNKEKVAIVLTDGNDTESLVPPKDAAILAKSKGVKIHMVAMGDPLTTGEQALDMTVIENVARVTGGNAYQALSSVELQSAYDEISRLEPELYESLSYQPKVSMHHIPVQIAIIIFLLITLTLTLKREVRKND